MSKNNFLNHLKFLVVLFFSSLPAILAQEREAVKKRTNLHVQLGHFNSLDGVQNISGFESLNIGLRRNVKDNRYHGIEFTLDRGHKNEIRVVPTFDSDTLLQGGNMNFSGYYLNYYKQRILNHGNKFEYGFYLSTGISYERLVTNPDPFGFIINEDDYGLNFLFTPCVYYHFDKISLLLDLNFSMSALALTDLKLITLTCFNLCWGHS